MNADGPDLRDLADAIWLARTLGGGPPPPRPDGPDAAPADPPPRRRAGPRPDDLGPDPGAEHWRSISASPAPAATPAAGPDAETDHLVRRTIDARVARERPLPQRERLARALRPLRRSVVAGAGLTVDEPATAQHLANVGTMTPVFRPLRERWLELAIVVDGGSTMRLWQQTARALRSLAERRGAFRDVRTYRLDTDGSHAELFDDGGNPHHFRELSDHAGRRLVLVVTDGVGPLWRTAAAHDMLAGWARRNPIAIVQVLPQAIWHRTALPPATVVLRSTAPGRVGPAGPGRGGGPWIPVVPLRAVPLEAWARLLAGHELNGIAMPAVPVGLLPAAAVTAEPTAATTPREQVARFQSTASPAAFALAGRLAAAPLTLPLMRAVQNVLHPGSDLGHLAEILLSGLLVQLPAGGPDEDVQYEFRPGIRAELLRTRSRRDAYSVLETLRDIAPFVPNPYGSLDVWALSAEPDTELGEHRQGRRFAEVAITVLGGLGGRYADMADRIQSYLGTAGPVVPRVNAPAIDVLISHANSDQVWAEWIQRQLLGAGLRTVALSEVSDTGATLPLAAWTMVLLSRDYATAPGADRTWRQIEDRTTPMLPVRLDSSRQPAPFADRQAVDLVGLPAERAYEALMGVLGLPVDAEWQDSDDPRFPAVLPPVWNVPQRNPSFAGRRDVLEQVRDRLRVNGALALHGLGGAGKTQVAVEYAFRFAANYDMVWWIPAEQPHLMRQSYLELGQQLHLRMAASIDESVGTVREALAAGTPYRRWLLIFDHAEGPGDLADYLPQGSGHVLVTSRNPEWDQVATAVAVGMFTEAESVALLTRRVPQLRTDEAARVAGRLGGLPLALEQAGAWLEATGMPVSQYVELLDTQPMHLLSEASPVDYERTVASTWLISLDRLRSESPAAAKMLEICAFFGPEPIPTRLLYAERFVRVLLPYDPALADPLLQGRLIREIGRYGLATLDATRSVLQVHPLLQAVIRSTCTDEDSALNRGHVHGILAAAGPGDPDQAGSWPFHAELLPHVQGSLAATSAVPEVRQLVVDTVRYLWCRGDVELSRELAQATADGWRADPRIGEDELTLLMDIHLGTALRSLGAADEALAHHRLAWQRLREQVPGDGVMVITAAGAVATDLRALGRFEEALSLSEQTFATAEDAYGAEHPLTLTAMADLAGAMRSRGNLARAVELSEFVLTRSRTVLGAGHVHTLQAADNHGHDLREVGRYEQSHSLLAATLDTCRTLLGPSAPLTLRTATNLAATLRKRHALEEARNLTRDTLTRLGHLGDDRQLDGLACLMNAALEQSALGEHDTARRTGLRVLGGYDNLFGKEHPARFVVLANLVTLTSRGAWPLAQEAFDGLAMGYGHAHPYTLVSRVNMANALFNDGDLRAAADLDLTAWQELERVLGPEHPDSLVAAANLLTTGGPQDLRAATLARSRQTLGDDHPITAAVREGRRLGCDITLPPL